MSIISLLHKSKLSWQHLNIYFSIRNINKERFTSIGTNTLIKCFLIRKVYELYRLIG